MRARYSPRTRSRPRCVLALEQLEVRAVPACATTLTGGMLRIDCDAADDVIQAEQLDALIRVTANGEELTFPEDEVNVVAVMGGEGADQITLDIGKRGFVVAGAGNDLVRVWRTGTGTITNVTCGSPDDVDRVEVGKEGGTVDELRGVLNIHEQRAGPLFIYDDGSTTGHYYGIDGEGHVFRGGREIFNYTNSTPNSVSLFTGSGDDTALIGTVPANRSFRYHLGAGDDTAFVRPTNFFGLDIAGVLDVQGGPGKDTIRIDEQHNPFGGRYLVGPAGIQRRGIVGWTEVEGATLQTGNHNDRFVMQTPTKPSLLALDAGGGTDRLDYSESFLPVQVSLRDATADGLAAVASVENVYGSPHDDVLRGDAADNLLDGGDGHDLLLGEAGADTLLGGHGRDILIGGLGADRLEGGYDDDILISGTTSYDDDQTLPLLLQVWAGEEPYEDRVTVLRDYLNEFTVVPDEEAGELLGGEGLDWFWGDFAEVLDQEVGEYIN